MNVITSGKRQEEGLQDFLKIYYKEELKYGSLKRFVKTYIICFLILISFCFIFKGMRELFLPIIYFMLGMVALVSLVILISLKTGKKRLTLNEIDLIEQSFNEKYEITTKFKKGSVEKTSYSYTDILKVIETKEFFYIFLASSVAMPVDKNAFENIDEFKQFIKSKNIIFRESKKNEI